MKKAFAVLFTAFMGLSVCACGGSNTSAETKTADAAETSVEESSVEEEKATAEETSAEPETEPETVTETDYVTLEGIYVDNSYVDKENDKLKRVYVFYIAHTDAENLKISSKSSKMVINDVNEYTSARFVNSWSYFPNYYYSDYLKDVYVGDQLKTISTFKIPEGELSEGRDITLSLYGIPDSEKLKVKTDDIKFCESEEEISELVDPEGYETAKYNYEDADAELTAKVKEAINGYQWDFFVNSTSYQIEFFDPNKFELRALTISNGGTYEVKNGFVLCTYENGLQVHIPYTWEENDINLDVVKAFDVNEM